MELPWLISISRQNHEEKVLVIAEDYATLYKVNERWPGHAVLIPSALDPQAAHKFGSQATTSLEHLELGYNVMYNDVDMVWLQDPFQYLQGSHDAYFMDDMIAIKPLNHSHGLPPRSRGGVTYVCSCMIFLPTDGAKLLMKTPKQRNHMIISLLLIGHFTKQLIKYLFLLPPNSTSAFSKIFTSFVLPIR
ncbi:hypothetical protein ARALYDRAFT_892838 [Arabidopsis lyrata subsp. lyrata]|uniref:Nucleotide-diphospho-sugar transferase domain-containing protein n=1 Tax=Arabidopsis lyrata subsp. lyrata TaxID=81972 RepID=D7KB37_ARALL|nr:hypothetical protein ARALYDRAFT_892838 [Arabidopsis lyrata subsp. lyrata]